MRLCAFVLASVCPSVHGHGSSSPRPQLPANSPDSGQCSALTETRMSILLRGLCLLLYSHSFSGPTIKPWWWSRSQDLVLGHFSNDPSDQGSSPVKSTHRPQEALCSSAVLLELGPRRMGELCHPPLQQPPQLRFPQACLLPSPAGLTASLSLCSPYPTSSC